MRHFLSPTTTRAISSSISGTSKPTSPQQPKLLDQVRERIRVKHYSIRTERAYVEWIKRYILFHGKRHPKHMGADEVEAFLSSLASERKVVASTQNQLMEATRLRVKDIDLTARQITVRDGKGAKDRVTMMPELLIKPLRSIHLSHQGRGELNTSRTFETP